MVEAPITRENRTLSNGGVVHFTEDLADLAELLLMLSISDRTIRRNALIAAWKIRAGDLNASESGIKYKARGSYSTAILTGMIRDLEKAGVVRRAGSPPRHTVIITDRAALYEIVRLVN